MGSSKDDPTSANGKDTLGDTQYLAPGESLKNGDSTLTWEPNGQLVLSDKGRGVLQTWDTPLANASDVDGTRLQVGSSGNLVIVKGGKQIGTVKDLSSME